MYQNLVFERDTEIALYREYIDKNIYPGNNSAGYFAYELSNVYIKNEDYDKAYVYIKKAEKYIPANAGIKFTCAHILFLLGQNDLYIEKLRETLSYATDASFIKIVCNA